jgi:hypothetical protein
MSNHNIIVLICTKLFRISSANYEKINIKDKWIFIADKSELNGATNKTALHDSLIYIYQDIKERSSHPER